MAIGAGAAGAWAATNATTHTVTLPAHATGDFLLVIAACKAATVASVNMSITTPASGWRKIPAADFADGALASGNGTGSVIQSAFWKIAASGAETNPVVTWGGSQTAAPGIAVGLSFTKGASDVWLDPAIVQAATTNATSISVSMANTVTMAAGDWGVIAHTTRDDSALTVPTWTATGTTLGSVVVYPATPIASGTSNDMAGTSAYRAITAGPNSAGAVVTGTQAAAETGATCFIRLRVIAVATTLYFRNTAPEYSTGTNTAKISGSGSGWVPKDLLATPGSAASSALVTTAAGPTSGLEVPDTLPFEWWSFPLDAGLTITSADPVALSLWGLESVATVNATLGCQVWKVNGATGAQTLMLETTNSEELSLGFAVQNFTSSPLDTTLNRGDRIRATIFANDAGGTMAAGSATFRYDGASHAEGGSFIAFTNAMTFMVDQPVGSEVFLTDAASTVATASLDKHAWTARGSGIVSVQTSTANGWTAPIQVTDSGGGTAIDWFTPPLQAFTLTGPVRAVVPVLESNASANVALRCEVARVDGDGTNATVWSAATGAREAATSETFEEILFSGQDLAISAGQRLRIRLYADDSPGAAMASGFNLTVRYSGTSDGASGDASLLFTQTLLEVAAASTPKRNTQIPQLLAH